LGAIAVAFVAPDSFSVFLSITLFVGLCAGGAASIGGTIVGAIFIEFVPNLADQVSKAAPGAVYGVILIAMLFLMPMGAGGFLASLWRKAFRSGGNVMETARPAVLGHSPGPNAVLGHSPGPNVDLTGTLSGADGVRVHRGESVKP